MKIAGLLTNKYRLEVIDLAKLPIEQLMKMNSNNCMFEFPNFFGYTIRLSKYTKK